MMTKEDKSSALTMRLYLAKKDGRDLRKVLISAIASFLCGDLATEYCKLHYTWIDDDYQSAGKVYRPGHYDTFTEFLEEYESYEILGEREPWDEYEVDDPDLRSSWEGYRSAWLEEAARSHAWIDTKLAEFAHFAKEYSVPFDPELAKEVGLQTMENDPSWDESRC